MISILNKDPEGIKKLLSLFDTIKLNDQVLLYFKFEAFIYSNLDINGILCCFILDKYILLSLNI